MIDIRIRVDGEFVDIEEDIKKGTTFIEVSIAIAKLEYFKQELIRMMKEIPSEFEISDKR